MEVGRESFLKIRFGYRFLQFVFLVWSSIFQFAFGEEVFKKFIDRLGDGRGGYLVDDTRLYVFEVVGQVVESVYRAESVGYVRQSVVDVGQVEGYVFLSVEEGFIDVQRGGGGRGKGFGQFI